MSEITRSPLSRHDLDVTVRALKEAGITEYQRQEERQDNEIVISSRRVKGEPGDPLRVLGVPLRLSEEIGLNEGLLIRQGREPISFTFEGLS